MIFKLNGMYECTHKGLLAHRLIYRHCTILMCLCGGCGRHCRFQEHITYYIQPNMECTWIYALHFTPSLYGYIFNALYGEYNFRRHKRTVSIEPTLELILNYKRTHNMHFPSLDRIYIYVYISS